MNVPQGVIGGTTGDLREAASVECGCGSGGGPKTEDGVNTGRLLEYSTKGKLKESDHGPFTFSFSMHLDRRSAN